MIYSIIIYLPQLRIASMFLYSIFLSDSTLVFPIITTIMFASENICKTPITKLQNNPTEDRIDTNHFGCGAVAHIVKPGTGRYKQ